MSFPEATLEVEAYHLSETYLKNDPRYNDVVYERTRLATIQLNTANEKVYNVFVYFQERLTGAILEMKFENTYEHKFQAAKERVNVVVPGNKAKFGTPLAAVGWLGEGGNDHSIRLYYVTTEGALAEMKTDARASDSDPWVEGDLTKLNVKVSVESQLAATLRGPPERRMLGMETPRSESGVPALEFHLWYQKDDGKIGNLHSTGPDQWQATEPTGFDLAASEGSSLYLTPSLDNWGNKGFLGAYQATDGDIRVVWAEDLAVPSWKNRLLYSKSQTSVPPADRTPIFCLWTLQPREPDYTNFLNLCFVGQDRRIYTCKWHFPGNRWARARLFSDQYLAPSADVCSSHTPSRVSPADGDLSLHFHHVFTTVGVSTLFELATGLADPDGGYLSWIDNGGAYGDVLDAARAPRYEISSNAFGLEEADVPDERVKDFPTRMAWEGVSRGGPPSGEKFQLHTRSHFGNDAVVVEVGKLVEMGIFSVSALSLKDKEVGIAVNTNLTVADVKKYILGNGIRDAFGLDFANSS